MSRNRWLWVLSLRLCRPEGSWAVMGSLGRALRAWTSANVAKLPTWVQRACDNESWKAPGGHPDKVINRSREEEEEERENVLLESGARSWGCGCLFSLESQGPLVRSFMRLLGLTWGRVHVLLLLRPCLTPSAS